MVKKIKIIHSEKIFWYRIGEEYEVFEEDEERYFTYETKRNFWISKKNAQEIIKELEYSVWD